MDRCYKILTQSKENNLLGYNLKLTSHNLVSFIWLNNFQQSRVPIDYKHYFNHLYLTKLLQWTFAGTTAEALHGPTGSSQCWWSLGGDLGWICGTETNPRRGNRHFGSHQQREKATHGNNRYRGKGWYANHENFEVGSWASEFEWDACSASEISCFSSK